MIVLDVGSLADLDSRVLLLASAALRIAGSPAAAIEALAGIRPSPVSDQVISLIRQLQEELPR